MEIVDPPQIILPEELLHKHFGYNQFRPLQREAIDHLLAGNDAVILMPTGGGKSLCFQIPALALDGITLVVSPLIALMKDQVQALQANGIAAAFLNSTLSYDEEQLLWQDLRHGALKLLYVSPERIFSQGFLDAVAQLPLRLIAIDEAHCISNWGHHFRPEYKRLHVLKERFPNVPVAALTATADEAVRSDIGELLGMRAPRLFIASFDRPNLSLAVLPGQKKSAQLGRILAKHNGQCGIIYCQSRKSCEQLAERIRAMGIRAAHYHAGMEPQERSTVQDEFIQGRCHVICATIAFGMGIDKSDVRFVIHWNMPGSVESYYQEIGRAGRDGKPAETILFYSYADVQRQLHFIDEMQDDRYRAIQMAKLERMKDFAEAGTCRRKMLLSYFSEMPADDCGNCDVCKDPPKWFDGTQYAQMALSAVARSRGTLPVGTLVDVLKGTRSAPVQERQLNLLQTFGVGAGISEFVWQLHIQQFIQQGLLTIDYKDNYHLKLTPHANEVLFKGRTVRLVSFETIKERQDAQKQMHAKEADSAAVQTDAGLFDRLKALRSKLAKALGKPAYIVFSDAALLDMCARKPATMSAFLQVNGVGEYKAEQFGEAFLDEIAGVVGVR
ncbi:MAG: DNA helicase RecQ [Flavobacteriales bacterium]|nr:DNA helicase RecQ [Flavobacteriales bacterium]